MAAKVFSYQFDLQGGTDKLTRFLALVPKRDDNEDWIKEIKGHLSLETSISGSAAEKNSPEYSVTIGLGKYFCTISRYRAACQRLNATLVLDKKALVLKI